MSTLRNSAAWTAIDTISSAALAFCFRLVVARILSPTEFGLAAIMLAIIAILQVINDFGLTSALIQKDKSKVTTDLINTTFTVSALVSAVLAVATVLVLAPLAARFYGEPALKPMIGMLALCLLPSPFTTVAAALLYREKRFKAIAITRLWTTLISLTFAGFILWFRPSPWVVIWQALATSYTTSLGLNIAVRWRFKAKMNKSHIKELFGFSSLILTNDLAVAFSGQAGVFILSRLASVPEAGLFSLATYMTDAVRRTLMSILNRVTFVHYSSIQADKYQLRKAYLSTLTWNCRMIFPIMMAFILFGPEILIKFLGSQWKEMESVIIWLSIAVMIHAAGGTTSTLYKGIGKPGLDLSIFLSTTLLLLFPGLVVGIFYGGLIGAAIATAITRLVSIIIRQVLLNKLLGSTAGNVVRIVAYILALQLPIILAWIIYQRFFEDNHIIGICCAALGLIFYGLLELPRAFPKLSKRLNIKKMPWLKEDI